MVVASLFTNPICYGLQIFSSVQHCSVVRSNTNAICYLLVKSAVKKLVLQDEASLLRLHLVPRGCLYPFPMGEDYAIAILHENFLTQATNLVTSFIPFVQTKSRCWERIQACVLHLEEAICINPPSFYSCNIQCMHLIIRERDPEYRARYRVTRIMQGLGRFLAVQKSWKNFMWIAKLGRKRIGVRKEESL